ncbi:MAG: class I SAM-dependent methyltransferase [Chloroflexota bacterium]|nr:class I SAM-dependent methyltransferase [Chloroflexota bacterium]MDE2920700.1 class I SAM-dependent methyltransferase [Chloroflexota bacterium]
MQSRARQIEFYASLDAESEIERPHHYPRPVRLLIKSKFHRALRLLGHVTSTDALCVCGGSGMDAEWLARLGIQPTILDISPEALARARIRAQRHGFKTWLVRGDATRLPFRSECFGMALVHDGLHHLGHPYCALDEMARVARQELVLMEPARAALTRLAVAVGLAADVEPAGNAVRRLNAAGVRARIEARSWRHVRSARDFVYYQPWTFAIYRMADRFPVFAVFVLTYRLLNFAFGRWGNSLKVVARR